MASVVDVKEKLGLQAPEELKVVHGGTATADVEGQRGSYTVNGDIQLHLPSGPAYHVL